VLSNEEVERLDYDNLAKLIVGRAKDEKELLAAIEDALVRVAMWADKNVREELKP